MELYPLHITNFKVDGGVMFGVVPKGIWQKKYPADENNLCNWSLRSMVIKTGDRVVLIDTGYGNKQDESFFKHTHLNGGEGLEAGLNKCGVGFDDVTDVIITHLHADHCGGTIKKSPDGQNFEPLFRNAKVWISKTHWEWATESNIREKDAFLEENILPIKDLGLLNLVEEESEIIPGIEVRFVNGHTKGQLLPIIHYNNTRIIFAADLIPSVAHIPLLFNMAYDLFPLDTIKEKEQILNEALENNDILFFEHDVYHECCNLTRTKKGIRANEMFTLNEFIEEQSN
jgi:glyoxylase-like metal-dependent hydrolase (beta-lactamase superfamily II)